MILPYLYYCNLAWGGTYKVNLQRIVILQKRALRIVNNSTYDANTSPIFKELKLLKFHDIHSFQLGFFMFSLKNSTLPSKFNNLFLINSQIHNYYTRNAHSFRLPLCRTNTRQFSIYFQDPKFYIRWILLWLVRPPPLLFKESLKNSFLVHISFSMALIRLLD